jgi:H+-translocating NAD(P) transhydrogenase subunit beta
VTRSDAIQLAYLVASICFILGLKFLSGPRTARRGNVIAAIGMLIAIIATLADSSVVTNYWLIGIGIAIGAVIGAVSAQRVKMTAMPQMVALFNGVGGGAAALIAASEYHIRASDLDVSRLDGKTAVSIMFSAVVGSISFAGSMVAFGKLQELLPGRPITWPAQKLINALLLAAVLALAIVASLSVSNWLIFPILLIALVIGVAAVLPIGGADMPVVISLLNSFTGLAAAATGFVLSNDALIIAGTLVGASGTLLTQLMSKAMNRSLANVLFGAFGGGPAVSGATAGGEQRPVREATVNDVAVLLAYARRVVFVPGYGLAVAQAQHGVRELATQLEKRGVDVKYAIHPVAGRMPGHMNVLLAEADVPYDQLWEMEQINPELPETDVAVIIGANDVVNPAARDEQSSPLYGMPIVEVDRAENVVVLKRSMASGFAGIDNELFYNPKTMMLFGDAKSSVTKLVQAVAEA